MTAAADDARRPAQPDRESDREPDWRRRRRLAGIFGDTLPESTSDDLAERDGAGGERSKDDWLRAQVPPHHGG
ncbi:hypothetical protein [Nocardioides insulae]|uniref:hypothetical protein n=1 Tax=Nocardioides insulae TaxID=394734 RepID=UPI00040D1610|nr:hypothetical protein [Nocardioides insulae]